MAIDAVVLDALLLSGASAEMIVAAVKADAEREKASLADRRSKAAQAKRDYRAKLSGQVHSSLNKSVGLERTEEDSEGLSPAKERSPTPPKENITSLRSDIVSSRKAAFAEFWRIYPKREGSNPKQPAEEKFYRIVKAAGPDGEAAMAAAIIEGAGRYAESRRGEEPRFTMQTQTWLNKGCWKDDHSQSVIPFERRDRSHRTPPTIRRNPAIEAIEELKMEFGG